MTEAVAAWIRVPPVLNEVEYGHVWLGLGPERFSPVRLPLEVGEEAAAESVVVPIADGARGRANTGHSVSETEVDARIWTPLIQLLDGTMGSALVHRHIAVPS